MPFFALLPSSLNEVKVGVLKKWHVFWGSRRIWSNGIILFVRRDSSLRSRMTRRRLQFPATGTPKAMEPIRREQVARPTQISLKIWLPCVKGAVAVRRLRDCKKLSFHTIPPSFSYENSTSLYTREASGNPYHENPQSDGACSAGATV